MDNHKLLVIILTSIYFCYKIYKSITVSIQPHYRDKRQSLQENLELNSTVSVLIVGGIDGLLNLLVPLIWLGGQFVFTQNPLVRQVYTRINVNIHGTNVSVIESSSYLYGVYSENIRECSYINLKTDISLSVAKLLF